MKYRNQPPKYHIPHFIRKYYNKYVVNDFLVQLALWASKEFFDCVKYYATTLQLSKWIELRKCTPAHVLASHPDFLTIVKSTSVEQWRQTDRLTAELFADAFVIWKKAHSA